MRRPLSFSLFFFALSRSLHAGSSLWAKFKTCMLLTHTLGRTTPPPPSTHTHTPSHTHVKATYICYYRTNSQIFTSSSAQQGSAATAAEQQQLLPNVCYVFQHFSCCADFAQRCHAATLRRVAPPQWTLVLKIFMLPAVEAELVGQHRILATVATASSCFCHCPSCVCLCLCHCYLCPCHCPWHWHCHCCCCLFCSSLTFDVTVSPA